MTCCKMISSKKSFCIMLSRYFWTSQGWKNVIVLSFPPELARSLSKIWRYLHYKTGWWASDSSLAIVFPNIPLVLSFLTYWLFSFLRFPHTTTWNFCASFQNPSAQRFNTSHLNYRCHEMRKKMPSWSSHTGRLVKSKYFSYFSSKLVFMRI